MLPDIRVVVTAIATTVLILVGIGLMASIRITHQSLSAQSDQSVGNRMTWRQPETVLPDGLVMGYAQWRPEPVLSLPHEVMDLATLAPGERDLAERVPAPRYASASLDPAESPQLAARVAEELALAHPSGGAEPAATASADPKIKLPTKKMSTPPANAKPIHPAAAKARIAQVHAAKPKRAARRTARAGKPNDKALMDALLGLDQTQ